MELEERIGQLIMIGFDGIELRKDVRSFIEKYCIGNFILFERNYKNLERLINLTSEIHSLSRVAIPLIAVDQEGGRVLRFKEPFAKIPSAQHIGKLIQNNNSIKISYEIGRILGRQLAAAGVNMNLAPVLDLNTNPKNRVIGDRSYGSDPILVSRIGLSMVAGLQDNHVVACGKHFPGHGDTDDDSHSVLPVIKHDVRRLITNEIRPFAHCIKNGLLSIMTAHVKYEKIDSTYPASLSELIVGKLLRKSLRFTGIVLTDDLCMGAIKKNYEIQDAAVLAVKAGADIVLVSRDLDEQKRVFDALYESVQKKKIEELKINEAVARVLRIKKQFLESFKVDLKKTKEIFEDRHDRKFLESLSLESRGIA